MNRKDREELPFANSYAAELLAHGLRALSVEQGISLRQVAKALGFKHAAPLSHMATGRMPIPLDRAQAIATEVGLPVAQFLLAALQQRHPAVEWHLMNGSSDPFATDLRTTAGKDLGSLPLSNQRILREVVRDGRPDERWLAIPEISAVALMRKLFPRVQTEGLSPSEQELLRTFVEMSGVAQDGSR